jgi:Tfp pilus assembly protein PilW
MGRWARQARVHGRRLKARLGQESGFSLIEIMVGTILSLVLATGIVDFMLVSFDRQNQATSRTTASAQAETELEYFLRDIRQAQYDLTSTGNLTPATVTFGGGSSSSSFYLPPSSGTFSQGTKVTWACSTSAATCTRTVGATTITKLSHLSAATFLPTGGTTSGGTTIASSTACTTTAPCCTATSTTCSVAGTASSGIACTSSTQCTTTSPTFVGVTLQESITSQAQGASGRSVRGISHVVTVQDGTGLWSYQ